MAYGKKHEDDGLRILERIKDLSLLIPGHKYHLRKMLRREGNVIFDEVHDIVLKEVKEDSLIEQDTDASFSSKEFEVFVRRKI